MFSERVVEQSRQVIEVDGERVGVLEIDDRPDELYLALLELSPSWQGKGLGTDTFALSSHRRSDRTSRSPCMYSVPTREPARSTSEKDCMSRASSRRSS